MDIVKLENVSLLAASSEVNKTLSDDTPDDVIFKSRNSSLWGGAEE